MLVCRNGIIRLLRILAVSLLCTVVGTGCLSVEGDKIVPAGEASGSASGEFIGLDAGFVHYEMAGPPGARTIVLIHGFSVPYYVWDPTMEDLHAAGFRTLRYDLYGRGWSDRPRTQYNLELYVSQLEELLEQLEVELPVDIAALSFGGPIAASYTHRFPERVRRVCLVAPQVAPVRKKDVFPLNVPILGEILMGTFIVPIALPRMQKEDFFKPDRFPDWEARYREPMKVPGFSRAILSSMRNLPDLDAKTEYERLAATGRRVQLVWGREDKTISSEDVDSVLKAIPKIEFHIVEEAGHLVHYERPEIVNPALLDFFERK